MPKSKRSVCLLSLAEEKKLKQGIAPDCHRHRHLTRREAAILVREARPVARHFDSKHIVQTLIPKWEPASSIGPDLIQDAACGDRRAHLFVECFGASERARWAKLLRPFVPDPFEGRATMAAWTADAARIFPAQRNGNGDGHRPPRDRELFQQWERILNRFGLGRESLAGETEAQHVIIPAGSTPPLKGFAEHSELTNKYGVRWQSLHGVPLMAHERQITPWTLDDRRIREFVLHRFPALQSPSPQKRARVQKRAAVLVAVIYLWFRALLTVPEIAEEIGLTEEQTENMICHVRKHAPLFFAGTCTCRRRSSAGALSA